MRVRDDAQLAAAARRARRATPSRQAPVRPGRRARRAGSTVSSCRSRCRADRARSPGDVRAARPRARRAARRSLRAARGPAARRAVPRSSAQHVRAGARRQPAQQRRLQRLAVGDPRQVARAWLVEQRGAPRCSRRDAARRWSRAAPASVHASRGRTCAAQVVAVEVGVDVARILDPRRAPRVASQSRRLPAPRSSIGRAGGQRPKRAALGIAARPGDARAAQQLQQDRLELVVRVVRESAASRPARSAASNAAIAGRARGGFARLTALARHVDACAPSAGHAVAGRRDGSDAPTPATAAAADGRRAARAARTHRYRGIVRAARTRPRSSAVESAPPDQRDHEPRRAAGDRGSEAEDPRREPLRAEGRGAGRGAWHRPRVATSSRRTRRSRRGARRAGRAGPSRSRRSSSSRCAAPRRAGSSAIVSGLRCAPPSGSRSTSSTRFELLQPVRREAHRLGGGFLLVLALPQDRRATLRRDHRVDEYCSMSRRSHTPMASAPPEPPSPITHADDRHPQRRHLEEVARDRLALAALLGADAGIRARWCRSA